MHLTTKKMPGILTIFILFICALSLINGCSQQSNSSSQPSSKPSSISVSITSPDKGVYHIYADSPTDTISFTGTATDNSDGQLSGDALVWSYTMDGVDGSHELGKGTGTNADPALQVPLPAGHYVIRLTATNSSGESNYAEKPLLVNQYPTQVAITSPAAGETVYLTDPSAPIELVGEAYDPEDGQLSGNALTWESDSITPDTLTPFATGTNVTQKFPVGMNTLWLQATDSNGAQISTYIQFTVVDKQNNLPPEVNITAPMDGSTYDANTAINLQGAATDDIDGTLTGNSLVWSSNIDGLLGSGTDITCSSTSTTCNKFLSPGTHTITLTAIDSGFQSSSKSINLSVNALVPTDEPPTNQTVDNAFIDTDITKGALLPNTIHLQLAAMDDKGLSGYYITEVDNAVVPTAPAPDAGGWISQDISSTTSFNGLIDYTLANTYPLGADVAIYVWFKDDAGQLSSYSKDTVRYLDIAKPINTTAADFIDNGDSVTYSKNVNLYLKAEDLWGVAAYYVSEDINPTAPTAADPGWVYVTSPTKNYDSVPLYVLKGAYADADTVTLSVWFKDAAGNITDAAATDTILYYQNVAKADFDAGFDAGWTHTGSVTAAGDWETGLPTTVNPLGCVTGECAGTIINGFYTGQESILTSPEINLPSIWIGEQIQMSVDHWHNFYNFTGPGRMGGGAIIDYSYLEIAEVGAGGVVGNWTTLLTFSGFSGGWQNLTQSLTAYTGKTVKLRFRLKPNANSGLGYAGWYLDNFKIQVN